MDAYSVSMTGGVAVTMDVRSVIASRVLGMALPRVLAAAALLGAAGCSSPPPPPPPTVVNVQANAALDTNRIYQLGSKSGFAGAEFFPLYKADTATLGPDLIKKDEFLLIPGGSKSLTLAPTDAVHAVGVFAAFRDFQNMSWRASADIPAHQTTTLTVTMDRTGVKLDVKSVKPASP
jgi:type VI secretion system protein VasD